MSGWGKFSQRERRGLVRGLVHPPTARALAGEIRQRHGSVKYAPSDLDEHWYEHLHALLGAPWPCPEQVEINQLLGIISTRLVDLGFGAGRRTYGWYSDADLALCSAIWCSVRHTNPRAVIETGVAHGVSSRVVLEALMLNDTDGHLWSIDLPHPLDQGLHSQTAAAVPDSCRPWWSYVQGTSRRRLPGLVAQVKEVDLFIHDSLHTARNTLFEMEKSAAAMAPHGIMLIDDIKSHTGFATFAKRHSDYETLVCPTPDRIGVFGIAVNRGTS